MHRTPLFLGTSRRRPWGAVGGSGFNQFKPHSATADGDVDPDTLVARKRAEYMNKARTLPRMGEATAYRRQATPEQDLHDQRLRQQLRQEDAVQVTDLEGLEIDGDTTEERHFDEPHMPWVFSRQSPMYKNLMDTRRFKFFRSRRGISSWSVIPKNKRIEEARRREATFTEYQSSEGIYRDLFKPVTLDSHRDMLTSPVSLYTSRRLRPDGLRSYEEFITEAEERDIMAEIMSTALHTKANYIVQDGRYCTNYFERELGVPGRSPLAWSTAKLPTLGSVLERAYRLGLIPLLPNTFQINEFVTSDSGYKRHRKHACLGPYIGILNLVSPDILTFRHETEPWRPKLFMQPRSLHVAERVIRYDYSFEVEQTPKKESQNINFTRHTKDYRVEVLFACVDYSMHPALDIADKMTTYANDKKRAAGNSRNGRQLALEGKKMD
eukprot:PhM_4_TR14639/c0_g1_i1/m.62822